MSCFLIVAPIVAGSWPAIAGLASMAAASLGYKILKTPIGVDQQATKAKETAVEVAVNEDEVLAQGLRPEESLVLVKDDFHVVIKRDSRGQLSIHVDSHTRSHKETEEEAVRIVQALRRQFAYSKTVETLKTKGFVVAEEKVEEDGRIRVLLRRFHGGDR